MVVNWSALQRPTVGGNHKILGGGEVMLSQKLLDEVVESGCHDAVFYCEAALPDGHDPMLYAVMTHRKVFLPAE
jgi:hypothetical protein